jgi:hypothetical protein
MCTVSSSLDVVPEAGLEPACPEGRKILSLASTDTPQIVPDAKAWQLQRFGPSRGAVRSGEIWCLLAGAGTKLVHGDAQVTALLRAAKERPLRAGDAAVLTDEELLAALLGIRRDDAGHLLKLQGGPLLRLFSEDPWAGRCVEPGPPDTLPTGPGVRLPVGCRARLPERASPPPREAKCPLQTLRKLASSAGRWKLVLPAISPVVATGEGLRA